MCLEQWLSSVIGSPMLGFLEIETKYISEQMKHVAQGNLEWIPGYLTSCIVMNVCAPIYRGNAFIYIKENT